MINPPIIGELFIKSAIFVETNLSEVATRFIAGKNIFPKLIAISFSLNEAGIDPFALKRSLGTIQKVFLTNSLNKKINSNHLFEQLKEMAFKDGITGNKVAVGIWAKMNGFLKKKK